MRMGALGVKGQLLDGSAQHAGEIMRAKHKGRFTGSMAIVLVGLALMAGGREAGAQTLTELVSNLQTRGGIGHLVCVSCTRAGLSQAYAQALTTGPGGATLHSIDMRVRLRTNEPQTPTLEIRRGAPNGPLVATLAGPTVSVPRQTRVCSFVAPAGTELAAMTTYFVVVKNAEIVISSTGSSCTPNRRRRRAWPPRTGSSRARGERL